MTKEVELILDDLYLRGFELALLGDWETAETFPCAVSVTKKASGFYRVQYGVFVSCKEEKWSGVQMTEHVVAISKDNRVHWGYAEDLGFKKKLAVANSLSLPLLKEKITCKELTEGKIAIGFSLNIYDCLTLQREGEEI